MVKVIKEELNNYIRSIAAPNTLIIIKPVKKVESSKEISYYVITRGYANG